MAIDQEVDLTLFGFFASDVNKNLLERPAWRYHRDHGEDDGRHRLLNDNSMQKFISSSLRILTHDEYQAEMARKKEEEAYIDCHRNIFKKYPDWYKLENPYEHSYDEDTCDRCGCNLHMLNKAWNVCKKCDDELQEDQEAIWGLVIPSRTNAAGRGLAGLAWAEERFFANGGAVQTEDNTSGTTVTTMNLNTGDITIVEPTAPTVSEMIDTLYDETSYGVEW